MRPVYSLDEACCPEGQVRLGAHGLPCLVGQAITHRLLKLVVREHAASGDYRVALHRDDGVDGESVADALLQHLPAVDVGVHVGDDGHSLVGLGGEFFLHLRREGGDSLQCVANVAYERVFVLGQWLVSQFLLTDGLELQQEVFQPTDFLPQFVVEQAQKLGLQVKTRSVDVRGFARKARLSIETAARQLRISSLIALAKDQGCNLIATGHQKDDNAETLIQRLSRGTGLRGLAGIRLVQDRREGTRFVRPMLCVRRSEIIDYLHTRHLEWRNDQTNADCRYRRNFIRHRLLPALQEDCCGCLVEQLYELSRAAQRYYELVCHRAERAWRESAAAAAGRIRLDLALLRIPKEYLPPINLRRWIEVPREPVQPDGEVWLLGRSTAGDPTVTYGTCTRVIRHYAFRESTRRALPFDPLSRWAVLSCHVTLDQSGGPVINTKGQLVGMGVWFWRQSSSSRDPRQRSGSTENGLALAADHVRAMIDHAPKTALTFPAAKLRYATATTDFDTLPRIQVTGQVKWNDLRRIANDFHKASVCPLCQGKGYIHLDPQETEKDKKILGTTTSRTGRATTTVYPPRTSSSPPPSSSSGSSTDPNQQDEQTKPCPRCHETGLANAEAMVRLGANIVQALAQCDMRDPDAQRNLVLMHCEIQEVLKVARDKAQREELIRMVSKNRDWTKNYMVINALCLNPKTPLERATKYLHRLNTKDLTAIARSKQVPGMLAVTARKLVAERQRFQ